MAVNQEERLLQKMDKVEEKVAEIAVLSERLNSALNKIETLVKKIEDLENEQEQRFVPRAEYNPLARIVWTLVIGAIMAAGTLIWDRTTVDKAQPPAAIVERKKQ